MDLYLLLHRTVMRYSGLYYTQRLPVLQAFDRQLDSLQHLCSAHIRGNALPLQTSLLSSSKAPYCSFRSRSGCRNLLRPHAHCYSFVVFLCISDDWKSEIQSGTVSSHYGSSYWMGNVDFRCLFACIIRNYLCEAQSPLKAIAPPSECSRRMRGNEISCLRLRFERFIASFERADAHLQLTVVPCQTENTTELNEWPLRTTENRNQHGDLRHSPSCLARFRSKLATERSPPCAERARNE